MNLLVTTFNMNIRKHRKTEVRSLSICLQHQTILDSLFWFFLRLNLPSAAHFEKLVVVVAAVVPRRGFDPNLLVIGVFAALALHQLGAKKIFFY